MQKNRKTIKLDYGYKVKTYESEHICESKELQGLKRSFFCVRVYNPQGEVICFEDYILKEEKI
jgi:hypothetical protein